MATSDQNPPRNAANGPRGEPADFVLDRALERFAGDRELFTEMVESFFTDTPASLSRMREDLAADDLRELSRRAHGLKGAVTFFAVQRLPAAARRLEQAADRRDVASLAAALADVEREHAALGVALAPYRRSALLSGSSPESKATRNR